MKRKTGLIAVGLLAVLAVGCSGVSVPSLFNNTPTPPPTQVPLPTRIAIAVPTPTVANLFPAGDSTDAAVMLKDFIDAVSKGNTARALTFWDTYQPGQPAGFAANVEKLIQEWIAQKRRLVLGEITYSGLDTSGKYVTLPMNDPRVERATALIRVDGIEYRFFLTQLKGGWFIEGVNTTGK